MAVFLGRGWLGGREGEREGIVIVVCLTFHNITKIYNIVTWHWQYSMKYSSSLCEYEEYVMEYCQSHKL